MKYFKQSQNLWIGIAALVFAVHGFIGCGKSNSGGPQMMRPGLAPYSNNCGPLGCFGATAGQQITRSSGAISYDDELDTKQSKTTTGRLMDLNLNISVYQRTGINNNFQSMGAANPYSTLGLNGPMLAMTYIGPVHVTGTLQVLAPILNCNIAQGSYQLQAQTIGNLTRSILSVVLGANVNGGQGFQIIINNLALVTGNVGTVPNSMADTRMVGAIMIPACDNATFQVD